MTRELADRLEAQVVGPLAVLEDHESRPADRASDPVDELDDERPAIGLPVGLGFREAFEQVVRQVLHRRLVAHRPEHVEQERPRIVPVLRCEVPLEPIEPERQRAADDGPQETRLPDAGLPGDEQDLPVAGSRLRQSVVGQVEDIVATDEDRAQDRLEDGHQREV